MTRSSIRRTAPLVAVVTLAAAGTAAAAPARPQIVGPAYVDDTRALNRMGLDLRTDGAPHLVRTPKVAGVIAMDRPGTSSSREYLLRQVSGERVVLFGKNSWVFTGTGLARLGGARLDDVLTDRFARADWHVSARGDAVVSVDGAVIAGFGAGGGDWEIPFESGQPRGPVAVTPGGRVYAIGGFPSILDAATGEVISRLPTLPAFQDLADVATAPDETARVVGTTSAGGRLGRVWLHRVGPAGTGDWSPVIAEAGAGEGLEITPISVGRDGSTYIGIGSTPAGARTTWRLLSIGADGVQRWSARLAGAPGRAAIDRSGNVWVFVSGELITLDRSGAITFRRRLADLGPNPIVAAHADGVVVTSGTTTVRFRARMQGRTPRAGVRVVRTTTPQAKPFRCVAPPPDLSPPPVGPKTCLYRLAGPQLEIDSPADGAAFVTIAALDTAGPGGSTGRGVRVLAGTNRLPLVGLADLRSPCGPGKSCAVWPGTYQVRVFLRVGGPDRVFTRTIRVLPSTGRQVSP